MQKLSHYIHGEHVNGTSGLYSPVYNASTGNQISELPLASAKEVKAAIASSLKAFPDWAMTSPSNRARVMFRFKELLEKNMDELSETVSIEHGKVKSDASGAITRGLEVVEFACGIPQLLKGEYSGNVARGIDLYSIRQPLGVVAGITPFNFPAMVPMWMFPVAIA